MMITQIGTCEKKNDIELGKHIAVQWCTPVIPGSGEAETEGSQVRGQSWQISKTLSQNK